MAKAYSKMTLQELRAYNREAKAKSRGQSPEWRKREAKERKPIVTRAELTGETVTTAARPSEEMLADARRRVLAPRPIVAWLMGDPAPGQSALDKRR